MVTPFVSTENRLQELQANLDATKAELRDLATMGAIITSLLELDAVLSVVMDMAIRLVDGEVGSIMLDEKGELKTKISWGLNEEFAKSLMYFDDTDLPTYSFQVSETIILNDLEIHSDDGPKVDSIICLPIKTSQECLGVMLIINKSSGGEFSEKDKESLEMILSFVAVAIDNSRLMKHRLKQQKQKQELAIAGQVQETILPQDINDFPGVEIGASYFPAGEVGGDFYDIIHITDDRFLVIIGDVSNKGVPAALVMSAAAGILKGILHTNPDLSISELTSTLNNLVAREIIKDKEMFITMFLCEFDMANKKVSYCNAGHMPGLFWQHRTGKIIQLAEGGSIVGQFEDLPFKQGEQDIASEDLLFLFTDGLTEAMDADGNLFGRERAEQVLAAECRTSTDEFCNKVKKWVERFQEGAAEDTFDDFTLLQVRVK